MGKKNESSLRKAVFRGNEKKVVQLLDQGGDANLFMFPEDEQTILHSASAEGHLGIVSKLIEKGANPNVIDLSGNTPLHVASKNGQAKVIGALLDAGADHTIQNADGLTAIEESDSKECLAVFDDKIEKPPIDKEIDFMKKKYAAQGDIFKEIMESKLGKLKASVITADLNLLSKHKQNPIHYAVVKGSFRMCCLVIGAGYSPNAKDKLGNTPVHYAAYLNKPAIVGLFRDMAAPLLEVNNDGHRPADLTESEGVFSALHYYDHITIGGKRPPDDKNPIDDDVGGTILHTAAAAGKSGKVNKLLESEVDPNCANRYGDTPLHVACKKGIEKIVSLLVEHNAFINAQNEYGETPLHLACIHKKDPVVYQLLDYQADITLKTKDGQTPAEAAKTKKAKTLLEKARKAVLGPGDSHRVIGDYLLGKTLGEGAFAKVKIGTHMVTKEKFAIKIVVREAMSEDDIERLYKEIFIMTLLRNDGIVRFHDHFESKKHIYVVMELCTGIDMFDYIMDYSPIPEEGVRDIFRMIVEGMCFVDQFGIVHRDLKPENLLIDPDSLKVKIIDFGLSNVSKQTVFHTACGSPHYVAPEILAGLPYGNKVDIWSLGVILYVLLYQMFPFDEDAGVDVVNTPNLEDYLDFDPDAGRSYLVEDVIRKMLIRDPQKRIGYDELREHEFVGLPPAKPLILPNVQAIKPTYVEQLTVLGFDEEFIKTSFEKKITNSCTQLYSLLVQQDRKKRKIQSVETVLISGKSETQVFQAKTKEEMRKLQSKAVEAQHYTCAKDMLSMKRVDSGDSAADLSSRDNVLASMEDGDEDQVESLNEFLKGLSDTTSSKIGDKEQEETEKLRTEILEKIGAELGKMVFPTGSEAYHSVLTLKDLEEAKGSKDENVLANCLREILDDQVASQYFENYLVEKKSNQYASFLRRVQEYEKDPKVILATSIGNRYLSIKSRLKIEDPENCAVVIKNVLEPLIKKAGENVATASAPADLFNKLKETSFKFLVNTSVGPFLESPLFESMLVATTQALKHVNPTKGELPKLDARVPSKSELKRSAKTDPHNFAVVNLPVPGFCSLCGKMVWIKANRCTVCQYVCHADCAAKVTVPCKESTASSIKRQESWLKAMNAVVERNKTAELGLVRSSSKGKKKGKSKKSKDGKNGRQKDRKKEGSARKGKSDKKANLTKSGRDNMKDDEGDSDDEGGSSTQLASVDSGHSTKSTESGSDASSASTATGSSDVFPEAVGHMHSPNAVFDPGCTSQKLTLYNDAQSVRITSQDESLDADNINMNCYVAVVSAPLLPVNGKRFIQININGISESRTDTAGSLFLGLTSQPLPDAYEGEFSFLNAKNVYVWEVGQSLYQYGSESFQDCGKQTIYFPESTFAIAENDRVCILCDEKGSIHCGHNGVDLGTIPAAIPVAHPLFAFVGLHSTKLDISIDRQDSFGEHLTEKIWERFDQ